MCTLSIIFPARGHLRLVTSRDESPRRAEAAPPAWRTVASPRGGVQALWPTDLAAGGTWVGVSQHGLALAIINQNLLDVQALRSGVRQPRALPPRELLTSRGLIIPTLLGHDDAESAMGALADMDLGQFAPFRLVAAMAQADRGVVIEASWDREALALVQHEAGPACWASSGLGDDLVLPRVELFREMVRDQGATAEMQDAFHAHRWEDRPEISVRMSRRGARTVSVSTLEAITPPIGPRVVTLTSEPVRWEETAERAWPADCGAR